MAHTMNRLVTAGLCATALLVLSACGGGDAPDTANTTYDFHPETQVTAAPETTVVLPDELVALDEEYRDNRVIEQVRVTPAESSEGLCAVELDFTMNPNAVAALEEGRWETFEQTVDEDGEAEDPRWRDLPVKERYLSAIGFDSPTATAELPCAADPQDDGATLTLAFTSLAETAHEYPYSAEEYEYLDEDARELADAQFDGESRWEVLDPMATAEINVTAEGQISIVGSDVAAHEYTDGAWRSEP